MIAGSLFALPIYKAVETAFNGFIALDPDASVRQQSLRGKVVLIDMSPPGLPLYFIFNEHRIELCGEFSAEPDAAIRGAPVSLAAVASGRTAMMQSDVVVEGDVDIANRFNRFLKSIDIDWEEHVASLVGDTPAHLLSRVARSAGSWVGQAQQRVQHNVADYLRDESGHLLHQWEMDEFIHDVDDLRDRTERLLQKVQASDDQTP